MTFLAAGHETTASRYVKLYATSLAEDYADS
jgi:hypothetical protein